jgi:hypothetical protein
MTGLKTGSWIVVQGRFLVRPAFCKNDLSYLSCLLVVFITSWRMHFGYLFFTLLFPLDSKISPSFVPWSLVVETPELEVQSSIS